MFKVTNYDQLRVRARLLYCPPYFLTGDTDVVPTTFMLHLFNCHEITIRFSELDGENFQKVFQTHVTMILLAFQSSTSNTFPAYFSLPL